MVISGREVGHSPHKTPHVNLSLSIHEPTLILVRCLMFPCWAELDGVPWGETLEGKRKHGPRVGTPASPIWGALRSSDVASWLLLTCLLFKCSEDTIRPLRVAVHTCVFLFFWMIYSIMHSVKMIADVHLNSLKIKMLLCVDAFP